MTVPRLMQFAATSLLLLGCNLPAALLFGAGEVSSSDLPARAGLDVRFQPGLPLINAAVEAPAAFSRLRGAAARLDLGQLSFGEASTILEGELLHQGMLVPLPAGVLTIRTIAPEAAVLEAPVVAVPVSAEPSAVNPLPLRQLPEVIGAYSAGRRTMVLATDGSYLLFGPAEPFSSGTFYLASSRLELHPKKGDKNAFTASGTESWSGGPGEVFTLIHETPVDDSRHKRQGRGGR